MHLISALLNRRARLSGSILLITVLAYSESDFCLRFHLPAPDWCAQKLCLSLPSGSMPYLLITDSLTDSIPV